MDKKTCSRGNCVVDNTPATHSAIIVVGGPDWTKTVFVCELHKEQMESPLLSDVTALVITPIGAAA